MEFGKLTEKINIAIKKMDIFVDNISYKKKGKYNFLEINSFYKGETNKNFKSILDSNDEVKIEKI